MDSLPQVACALIGDVEYRFVEGLASVTGDGEIVVCEAADGARRYATREVWEAGAVRFEASRLADEGVVTAASSNAEKLALFGSLFAMRADVYAKSYFNKKTSRVGYTPACTNEWARGVCEKPRVKCADCPHREFLPLDDAALLAHFRGSGREGVGIVAGYPLIDDDKTRVLAVDFDKTDWQQAVGAFRSVCEREGVPVAVERSRSGKGAHAWIFFSESVAASDARKLGCALSGGAFGERVDALRAAAHQLGGVSRDVGDQLIEAVVRPARSDDCHPHFHPPPAVSSRRRNLQAVRPESV